MQCRTQFSTRQHTSMTTEDVGTKLKSDDFVIVYVKEHVQV